VKPAQRAQNLPTLFFAALNKRLAQLRAEGADIICLDAAAPICRPIPG
jgi:hypothetical protein